MQILIRDILVSMTRKNETIASAYSKSSKRLSHEPNTGRWVLQDAKAHFSELVRRVRIDGPQHVTVHGRQEVVVISVEEFRRLKGDQTGEALIAAMQASPYRDVDIAPHRNVLPVRKVSL
ncbi:type II toxin-antitoxin system Phd/YefM family antitoxin [Mesorhizobium metallidurans]|nr:type II toxin-antitoxin system Phd/YefM family antitoxin [Mesorhizobium metallidurans]